MVTTTTDHDKTVTKLAEGVEFHRGKHLVDQGSAPTRVALVIPDVVGKSQRRSAEARKAEFEGLAEAIRLEIVFSELVKVRAIRPATFVGGGYVETLSERVEDLDIDLVLVDTALSPVQQRNLEERIGAKVLDRTALILEIFGERAATREGVLQVELAHLNYQKGRLVRSWTHLERQRGGGGFLGGPGETQIESDRRQLQERITVLEKRLDKVVKTRDVQRKTRDAVPFPVIALVGYTNAGKSSLFNRLTGAKVQAKDLLFATLDTTVRRAQLPHGRDIVVSDTVGFVADLPTDLVAAFRATLEEVMQADIILHVRDVSHEDHAAQAKDVLKVLVDMGIDFKSTPIVEVWNKIDLLPRDEDGHILALENVHPAGTVAKTVTTSAHTGEGMDEVLNAIETLLAKESRTFDVHVPHERGEDVGWLYSHGEVIAQEAPNDSETVYTVRVQPRFNNAFQTRFGKRLTRSKAG